MQTIVINGRDDLAVAEAAAPEPGPGQVRLRVRFVGICGSDLHYWAHGANGSFVVREPLVPGHELSATVDLDPSGRLAPGTPVTVHPATWGTEVPELAGQPHLWPNGAYLGSASTWPHTQGAMAELIVVDAAMVRVLPDGLPLRRAALAEPLAVALHGIALAGGVAGRDVLVGGSGPIGLLAAAGALAGGAARVVATDVLAGPLARASGIGVHETIDVSRTPVPAEAFDVVLECSGVPGSINAGLVAARRAATYVQVGIVPDEPRGINLSPMISKELTVLGSWRFHDEIDAAVELLAADDRFDTLITHDFAPGEVVTAFRTAQDSEASGKVLINLG